MITKVFYALTRKQLLEILMGERGGFGRGKGFTPPGGGVGLEGSIYALLTAGYCSKGPDNTYAACREAASADSVVEGDYQKAGQEKSGGKYYCYRAGEFFDTRAIPDDATLTSAILSLHGDGGTTPGDLEQYLHVLTGADLVSTGLLVTDYGQIFARTTSWGSFHWTPSSPNWYVGSYNAITLNATGLAGINKTGITKFAFRSSRDIDGDEDTEFGADRFFGWDRAEVPEGADNPKLVVTYNT